MRIVCTVETGRRIRLSVRDMLGRTVRILHEGVGMHDGAGYGGSFSWDGRDGAGRMLPSGTYLLTLDANGSQDVLPVAVLR